MEAAMQIVTRAEAGRRLALGLGALVREVPTVVALSPGGVRVASEIARSFDAPLDVIPGQRLEVPGRSHSVFGAVADGSPIVLAERVRELGLPDDYVAGMVDITRREVDQVTRSWRGGAPAIDLKGQTVVLVDDGASDAIMVAAAARALHEIGAGRLIYAAPAATQELCSALDDYCDDLLLLFPTDAAADAVVCDPQFEQTTRSDVGMMIRRSRSNVGAAAMR
jgi:predicted phosphoribosyltransferase